MIYLISTIFLPLFTKVRHYAIIKKTKTLPQHLVIYSKIKICVCTLRRFTTIFRNFHTTGTSHFATGVPIIKQWFFAAFLGL